MKSLKNKLFGNVGGKFASLLKILEILAVIRDAIAWIRDAIRRLLKSVKRILEQLDRIEAKLDRVLECVDVDQKSPTER